MTGHANGHIQSTESKAIAVIVSKEGASKTFYIHEHLLKRHSDFFTTGLSKPWIEHKEGSVRFPDDSPEYFDIFARFLYDGKIHSTKAGDRAIICRDEEWLRLAESWILGDKLLSTTFKDAVMDALSQKLITLSPPYLPHRLAQDRLFKNNQQRQCLQTSRFGCCVVAVDLVGRS